MSLRDRAHELCKAIVPACVEGADAWEHSRFCNAVLEALKAVRVEAIDEAVEVAYQNCATSYVPGLIAKLESEEGR